MTNRPDFDRHDVDRRLTAWLAAARPSVAPEHVLAGVREGLATTSRRPAWRSPDRWTWRHEARLRVAARALVLVAVVAALVAIAVAVVAFVGSPRPAPPYGLTRAGLIAVDSADGILVMRADGTDRRVLIPPDGQAVSPTWSRDGLRLAFWSRRGAEGPWSLVVVDTTGTQRMVLTEGVSLREREEAFHQPSNLSWSPDGRRIAYAADVGPDGGMSIFVATIGQSGAVQLTDPALLAVDPAWGPNGELIAFQSAASWTLHVVRPDGSGERQLSSLRETFLWPDWSPDGTQLATAAETEDGLDIYVVAADGSVFRDVSRDPSDEYSPSWSPDGSRLAWARVPLDGSEVRAHVVVSDPTGQQVLEIRIPADLSPPVWSPDGTRISSYQIAPDGTFESVVVLDPSGDAPPLLLPAAGSIGNGNWQRLP